MFLIYKRRCRSSVPFFATVIIYTFFHFLPPNSLNSEIHLYNLMEETFGEHWSTELSSHNSFCTVEMANENRLQQDHPCVIELIRRLFLYLPSPKENSPNLNFPDVSDPSSGQSKVILNHLKNKSGAFFVECGALDGEYGSNTLYMERYLEWKGILIEANRELFKEVLAKRRHAWSLPVCLSTKPFPTKVQFDANDEAGKIYEPNKLKKNAEKEDISSWLIEAQCFPLYSILLAVGQTRVDYFSLDVEGSEINILTNIPWKHVDIKTLTVEITSRSKREIQNLTKYMKKQGYQNTELMDGPGYYDLVFIKKS
ncbi:protein Star-like [Daphnia pulicaria]|uniref:protein Star-like n=1 Tax=Daphnia pulicaria TaxID=35523 RepID=UPI001EEBB7F6|nr:protein Star-like [Daphnia pulicaria]XP_046640361.1 protein Star-like [Daphnia pulicaria]XP_046640362.1 protein Star-like [Daphnia pulicaria]XP_046640363.1 protein Star-like [Daphnia pulicaria]XP_046640364.1 protein Star-like [Daphnia pulicaria]